MNLRLLEPHCKMIMARIYQQIDAADRLSRMEWPMGPTGSHRPKRITQEVLAEELASLRAWAYGDGPWTLGWECAAVGAVTGSAPDPERIAAAMEDALNGRGMGDAASLRVQRGRRMPAQTMHGLS